MVLTAMNVAAHHLATSTNVCTTSGTLEWVECVSRLDLSVFSVSLHNTNGWHSPAAERRCGCATFTGFWWLKSVRCKQNQHIFYRIAHQVVSVQNSERDCNPGDGTGRGGFKALVTNTTISTARIEPHTPQRGTHLQNSFGNREPFANRKRFPIQPGHNNCLTAFCNNTPETFGR